MLLFGNQVFGMQGCWPRFVLGALLCFGLSSPSFAGTVFTWETDEGTISFTDEQKRIPAKYRLSASTRDLGKLKDYPRYTPTGAKNSRSERSDSLNDPNQGRSADGQTTRATGFDGRSISIGGGRYGGGVRYQIPVGGAANADGGPIVTETKRVRPEGSLATRTIRVVKQGDRIISVEKGQLKQRSWAGTTATGQAEKDVLE